uniref:sensor histidine kinase n=1 Tax=Pararhizobium sp. IMCC3301 TaxID=3067904 RepID=UPI0027419CB2|nr:ATP-binding protein [Pararhizobium sp. IMCC3301]
MNLPVTFAGKNILAKNWPFWGWLGLLLVTIAVVSLNENRLLRSELASESAILHRLASQRADQHDAHLTALSAVATAGNDVPGVLFLDVANTILRFYDRIISIDLVSLETPNDTLSTGGETAPKIAALVVDAAASSDRALKLRANPVSPGTYLLIKRSPNTDTPRYGLSLTIDGQALVATDSTFWASPAARYSLSLPDGTQIAGAPVGPDPSYSKRLGSTSQPLLLEAAVTPSWAVLFPWKPIVTTVIAMSLAYLLILLILRQVLRTRQAEKRAQLSEQEARLAHASRVNALGEMASGLAHELTQPLTAILSQSQAGKHLLAKGDIKAVTSVLEDTIAQARRGSTILDRMRRWTRPMPEVSTESSLAQAARDVEALLLSEAKRQNIRLIVDLADGVPLLVRADPVELEQVIFNLVRNGLDAVANVEAGCVEIRSYQQSGRAILEVQDNGGGVADDIKPRLFDPFVTNKPAGTGLGLALCQRLMERMGGTVALVETRSATIFRIELPLAEPRSVQVAAQ